MNDNDGDGINDTVKALTFDSFSLMNENLSKLGVEVSALIFGAIADKYEPKAHSSWWKTMSLLKEFSKSFVDNNDKTVIRLLNISSVFCSNELITRPFVFAQTNANYHYWLTPREVAERAVRFINSDKEKGFDEVDFFKPSDYYHKDYYSQEPFDQRKIKELYS